MALLTFDDLKKLPAPSPGRRVHYGRDALEFGDLRLPAASGPHPVAIIIHGGCWSSEYNLDHVANLAEALAETRVATWSLEYARIGDAGGGWPGTFADAAVGADYLRTLAPENGLDLERVIAVGHSAGGQLALWLAARRKLPRASPLYFEDPLRLCGVVSLAGITDLRRAHRESVCGNAVGQLLGGSPTAAPERYLASSPLEFLPLGVPQCLVHGADDMTVPLAFSGDYATAAQASGDDARLKVVAHAGHFELIVPGSLAWPSVESAVRELLAEEK